MLVYISMVIEHLKDASPRAEFSLLGPGSPAARKRRINASGAQRLVEINEPRRVNLIRIIERLDALPTSPMPRAQLARTALSLDRLGLWPIDSATPTRPHTCTPVVLESAT